jgi:L-ascorbate metabolism protein UlaG (beta-lactamase superfamily)
MDIQFYGANCIAINIKQNRFVFDDNLSALGLSSVVKPDDVALFTNSNLITKTKDPKLVIDSPGEYEVANVSIYGIEARAHTDEATQRTVTIYKLLVDDLCVVILGHVYPELNDSQLEAIGIVDILIVPVGGHGYTLDARGALSLIGAINPKLVIPTHYADPQIHFPVPQDSLDEARKVLGVELREETAKLKIRQNNLSDTLGLVVLERVK